MREELCWLQSSQYIQVASTKLYMTKKHYLLPYHRILSVLSHSHPLLTHPRYGMPTRSLCPNDPLMANIFVTFLQNRANGGLSCIVLIVASLAHCRTFAVNYPATSSPQIVSQVMVCQSKQYFTSFIKGFVFCGT